MNDDDVPEKADKLINELEAFEPPFEAYRLRLRGVPWREVAKRCGYRTESSAAIAVRNYLQSAALMQSKEKKSEALAMEIARLDELQNSWWEAAVRGDDKAAQIVLRVISQRSKMLGIEDPNKVDDGGGNQKTILVMGSNKDYARQLQEIASTQPAPEEEDEES